MTESDMLHLEKENYTTIHLHLVGIFWRAYQRSACGFPLYNSSPLECMEFIARLQKQLGSDGSVR